MASVIPHGKKYRALVAVKGKRSSKVFDTKNEATLWGIEQEMVFKAGKSTVGGYTVGDAFKRYADEVSPTKKGERWEVVRLNKLSRDRLANIPIEKLEQADMQSWIDRQTISAGSVIRELNLMQSVIKQARRWRWTDAEPFTDLDRPKAPAHRDRLISEDEKQALINLHVAPGSKYEIVQTVFQLALETACRKGELLQMDWQHVHINQNHFHIPTSKTGKSRDVPLSSRAVQILTDLNPKKAGRVFNISSDSFDQLFRKLKKKAGVDGFTFHDTRHTAVTRLASKLSVLELARMVGHSDPRSLMWYYNETAEKLALKLD